MENKESSFFSESKHLIEQYIKDRILLLKLQTAEKTARMVGFIFTFLILSLLSFFLLLFVSMMLGYYFSSITGSLYVGFGILSGIYCLLITLMIIFRKSLIQNKVGDIIIKILFDKDELTS